MPMQSRTALGVTAVLSAAAMLLPAGDALAKKSPSFRSGTYLMTFRAQYSEDWSYRDYTSNNCLDGNCVREEKGSGTASILLKHKRPYAVFVSRVGNRPPSISFGADGLPATGPYLRTGQITTEYSGEAKWDAANKDTEAETRGCGRQSVDTEVLLGWRARNEISPTLAFSPFREDCPAGPISGGWDWQGGDAPSITDAIATSGYTKFGRTKSFTLRGTKKWTGTYPSANTDDGRGDVRQSNGAISATWTWEATLRWKGRAHR